MKLTANAAFNTYLLKFLRTFEHETVQHQLKYNL